MSNDRASPAALADIARKLRRALREVGRAAERELTGTGLTPAAWEAMQLVADRGPQTVPELARACALGRQNLQRVVDRLLERGLVERIANPAHRRSARFGLSPPGVATFHALRQREEEAVRGIAMGLAQADIDACRRVLDHLESGLRLSGRSPTG